jgi:hypothetical protein
MSWLLPILAACHAADAIDEHSSDLVALCMPLVPHATSLVSSIPSMTRSRRC